MNRFLAFAALISILFSSVACSKKIPPTQTAVQTRDALSTLRDLTGAYEKKQLSSFMDKVSKDYPDRQGFSQSIAGVFTKYDTIRFTIQYTKMFVMIEEKAKIKMTFNWDVEWQTTGGKVVKDGGRVSFFFDPKGARLLTLEGKNPFIPSESQGKQ
jgi:hypothetical protein